MPISGRRGLDTARTIEGFLAGIEKRAFRIARIATGNRDDALDIVQEAMMKLVERYSNRTAEEWAPLFYRILQSRIRDRYRRRAIRQKIHDWLGGNTLPETGTEDQPMIGEAVNVIDPQRLQQNQQAMQQLETTLKQLPLRQQQVFLLRIWEGLSVEDTAKAMSCTQGSVKTHFSRAVHQIRQQLGEVWP